MPKPISKSDKAYLDRVASLGCCICGMPAEIHHLRRDPITGIHYSQNQRAPHKYAIPLCTVHHRTGPMGVAYHAGPRTWESIHGYEVDLWRSIQEAL